MKWIGILAALAPLLTACGCAGGAATDACAIFLPIRPTERDVLAISDSLVAQIEAHNETGRRLCRWKP